MAVMGLFQLKALWTFATVECDESYTCCLVLLFCLPYLEVLEDLEVKRSSIIRYLSRWNLKLKEKYCWKYLLLREAERMR